MNSFQRLPGRDPGANKTSHSYEFGPFVLDTVQHLLLKDGQPIALTPKTYDTLLFLVQNSGRMISKEELMGALWPDSFVEESNLTQQISMVRKALGDTAGEQRYIVTVPARGYRFAGPVAPLLKDRPALELVALMPAADVEPGEGDVGTPVNRAEVSQTSPSSSDVKKQPHRRWQGLPMPVWIALAAILLLAGLSLYRRYSGPARIHGEQPRRLAILPFRNLKQDAASDFLGFSLADAVITKLGYVSALTVRPSSAVEKYRNQIIDIPKVGTDLNVDTLLTGNFIRDGDDLRITSQLIDVNKQNILWKGSFDLKYDKLLTVQDNVAQQIVKELALSLPPVEVERLRTNAPTDPLAYEYYLHGVDLYSRNDFPTAIKMLEKSAEIDRNHALTWAQLGRAYQASASFQFGGREQYRKAEAAYGKALALYPQQIESHIFMANLFTDTGRVEQSVPLLREAFATNPNHPELHWELGYAYRFGGMIEQSVAECERARQLDPGVKLNSSALNGYLYLGQYDKFLKSLPDTNDMAFVWFYRGFGEYYKKNWAQARQHFDRAFELDPSLFQAQVGKALSYGIAGEQPRGLAILQETERKIEARGVLEAEAIYKMAQAYAVLGDKPSALRMLRRSVDNGFFPYPYLVSDPLLESIRDEQDYRTSTELARVRHESFKKKFF
jgi:DNA-binding winged helix-turn-helix (wHTH) protein/TolB-like protein/Tfp pilus assembly protein PilF